MRKVTVLVAIASLLFSLAGRSLAENTVLNLSPVTQATSDFQILDLFEPIEVQDVLITEETDRDGWIRCRRWQIWLCRMGFPRWDHCCARSGRLGPDQRDELIGCQVIAEPGKS